MLESRRRGQSPAAQRRSRSGGFIQTLEFLLLLSIFGVVILFAVRIFNQWLLNKINQVGGNAVYVYDATPGDAQLIGKAVGFDRNQAPLVVLTFETSPGVFNRALLGMKNTHFVSTGADAAHFTSEQSVFYSNLGCTGVASVLNPQIDLSARDELEFWDHDANAATPGVDVRQTYHQVSDFYTLQGYVFAVGRPSVADHNVLYGAAIPSAYPGPPASHPGAQPRSVFVSQRHLAGRCIDFPVVPTVPDLRPQTSELLVAAVVDDLDSGAGYNFVQGVGFWTPVRALGTIPAGYTDPAPESGPLDPKFIFSPASDETTPP